MQTTLILYNSNNTTSAANPVAAHAIATQVVYIVCGFIIISIRLDDNIDWRSITTFFRAVCSGIYLTISTYILLPQAIFSSCGEINSVLRLVTLSSIWLMLCSRFYTKSTTNNVVMVEHPPLADLIASVILDVLYRLVDISGLFVVLYFWPPVIAWWVLLASLLRVISYQFVRPYTLVIFVVTSVGGFILLLVLINTTFTSHQFANLLVFTSVTNICMVYDIFVHLEPNGSISVITLALIAVIFTFILCLQFTL